MSLLRYAVSASLVVVAAIATGLPARASQDVLKNRSRHLTFLAYMISTFSSAVGAHTVDD